MCVGDFMCCKTTYLAPVRERVLGWLRGQPIAAVRRPIPIRPAAMCKTAGCEPVCWAHDNRCLPGEGRQVKTWLLTRRRGWRAAPTRGTRARFCEPARPLGTGHRAQRRHPSSRRGKWPVGRGVVRSLPWPAREISSRAVRLSLTPQFCDDFPPVCCSKTVILQSGWSPDLRQWGEL